MPLSTQASDAPSPAPTADTSIGELRVNAAQGWSVVVPTGWEVAAENAYATALYRGQAIAEILVGPSSGLTFEELGPRKWATSARGRAQARSSLTSCGCQPATPCG